MFKMPVFSVLSRYFLQNFNQASGENAMNAAFALGVSIQSEFRKRTEIQYHSLMSLLVGLEIIRQLPNSKSIEVENFILVALLQNIGLLLLAEWFPHEYDLLKRLAKAYPQKTIPHLESMILGMGRARGYFGLGHARLGAEWLEKQGVPKAVTTCIVHHHSENFCAELGIREWAILTITNRLLARLSIGDERRTSIPALCLEKIPLSEPQLLHSLGFAVRSLPV